MISRIIPSAAERMEGSLQSDTIERASRCFRGDGALIIEDIVDTATVAEARRQFAESYSRYLDDVQHEDALSVGNRRVMITVDLIPPFDDPQLFANPYLLPVLSAALGEDFVIGAYGVICSLPSAPAQLRHCDGGILFPLSGIDRVLPAAAITVAIPLIEMNKTHGTTMLWLGTHRDANLGTYSDPNQSSDLLYASRAEDFKDGGIEPVVSEGSCVWCIAGRRIEVRCRAQCYI
jgi:ectoine hydroxylase-related dioxygenase (phytanoyl-CoA dioxygenase family)